MNVRKLNYIDKDKLKPCPFCGEKPTQTTGQQHHFIGGWVNDVKLFCCIEMSESFGSLKHDKTKEEAKKMLMERWNTRV